MLTISRHVHSLLLSWLCFYFFFYRVLSCIQTGACYIWSYWPTYSPSFRGMVWMRSAHPWEVVTQERTRHCYWGQPFCILLQALTFTDPACTNRLLPATRKRHHYKFITASQKENIVLLNNPVYIIKHALFIWQSVYEEKEACVFLLSLTLVRKCPW